MDHTPSALGGVRVDRWSSVRADSHQDRFRCQEREPVTAGESRKDEGHSASGNKHQESQEMEKDMTQSHEWVMEQVWRGGLAVFGAVIFLVLIVALWKLVINPMMEKRAKIAGLERETALSMKGVAESLERGLLSAQTLNAAHGERMSRLDSALDQAGGLLGRGEELEKKLGTQIDRLLIMRDDRRE